MWVVKTHGETFYVNHVNCELPWSTKETSDNPHTKGSIKVKDCLLTIDDNNEATISRLTIYDKIRLRNQKLGITRIMWNTYGFTETFKKEKVKHGPFKTMYGGCGTQFTVCDILDKNDMMILSFCTTLIMGPSTLSAWSAYLNKHNNVYTPSIWTRHHWTNDIPNTWKLY